MKLLSLRLHPFGGTADRTIILHDGLNVLEGANEFGKSTMVEALWHVLFTPTEVAGRKRSEGLERWYPRTGEPRTACARSTPPAPVTVPTA